MSPFLMIALVGFLFLIASAFLGGHEVGGDHDIHGLDVHADHDVHHPDAHQHENSPSPFSIRVITVFLVAFGIAGDVAYGWGFGTIVSSVIGTLSGFGFGALAHQLLKFLWRQQSDSTVAETDFIGKSGEVKIAIPPSGLGQISIEVKGKRMYLPAREIGGDSIEEGAQVFIVESASGAVIVHRS